MSYIVFVVTDCDDQCSVYKRQGTLEGAEQCAAEMIRSSGYQSNLNDPRPWQIYVFARINQHFDIEVLGHGLTNNNAKAMRDTTEQRLIQEDRHAYI